MRFKKLHNLKHQSLNLKKSIKTYVIIALIALAVGAFTSSRIFDNREPEIKVEVDTIRIPQVDSTRIKFLEEELASLRADTAKVVIKVPVIEENPVGEPEIVDSVEVATTKYTGTQELTNGTIGYEIYADSLHAFNFTLETEKEIINTTITKTLPPKSALFVGGGVNFDGSGELGLMYNRRQKWQVGVVVNQDFALGRGTSLGVRAYIKL